MNLSALARHTPRGIDDADREAAVVAPVVDRGAGDALLFTKRADHLGQHPGQMSFPGGGHEPSDEDLEATARREADEEIGLRSDEIEIVGRLDDIPTVSDYSVRPFVSRIPDREYVPDEREVAEIAVLPVDELTDLDNYESERRDHPYYGDIRLHFFRVGGYTVWGATGRMLVQLLELTTEWEMPPEVDRVVDPDADFPV
jgi:8-oxo-dGTP pyrophosphatase MutT (NUDIX family)